MCQFGMRKRRKQIEIICKETIYILIIMPGIFLEYYFYLFLKYISLRLLSTLLLVLMLVWKMLHFSWCPCMPLWLQEGQMLAKCRQMIERTLSAEIWCTDTQDHVWNMLFSIQVPVPSSRLPGESEMHTLW